MNLCSIIRLAKTRNIKVYLLNYAGLVNGNATKEELARMHFPRGMGKQFRKYLLLKEKYDSALRKVSETTDTGSIDIAGRFRDKPARRRVFTDSVHFNEQCARIIEEKVSGTILPDLEKAQNEAKKAKKR